MKTHHRWVCFERLTQDGIGTVEVLAATTDEGIGVFASWTRNDDGTWSVKATDTESGEWDDVTTFDEEMGDMIPPEPPVGLEPTLDWEKIARWLYAVVDDIDSSSDHAKGDDAMYRRTVERLQFLRHEVGNSPDGQTVVFKNPAAEYGLTRLF